MIGTGAFLQQRYRIDKQIGQGGMGAVYVATDERFGSTVAIKETLTMDDNFRKAIEREARLLNSLKHVALPRVSDHFEEDNSQFLVMEYVPGEDLSAIIERDKRPFEVAKVLDWADQLLDALDFLHTQQMPVIHRDIKPQNLKLTPKGRIVLLDFGLAKGNPTDAGHQTAAKSIFGYSRSYASLEQIQGTGTDPRSDLYSLAATLYHLMTGLPPEDALTRAMSVLSQKADPLRAAHLVRSDIPRGVSGVLQKALDLNASERPGSAAEMRDMLREHEAYEYLAAATTITGQATEAPAFGQPTRLMPEGTRADGDKLTDLKTEIYPSPLSQVTSIREGGSQPNAPLTNVSPVALAAVPKSRGGAFAAIGAGLLLVCGAAAGGLYMAKPELFGTTPAASNVNSERVNSVVTTAAPSTNVNGSAETAGGSTSEASPLTTSPEKPKTTEKNAGDATRSARPAETDQGKVTQIDGNDGQKMTVVERPGETIMTSRDENGKVTTMRVPRDPADPKFPPGFPFPNGIDPSKLTPQQRERMKRAIRNGRIQPPDGYPRPQPPPVDKP